MAAMTGAAVLSCGCASVSGMRRLDAVPLLPPAAFGAEASQVQRLQVGRIGDSSSMFLDAAIQVDAHELRIAGFLLGQRVLLLVWDGEQLEESREPLVPSALKGTDIVRDLQLAYWPTAAINAALPSRCRMEEFDERRELHCDDKLVLESARTDRVPLGGAQLQNHARGYMISIEAAR